MYKMLSALTCGLLAVLLAAIPTCHRPQVLDGPDMVHDVSKYDPYELEPGTPELTELVDEETAGQVRRVLWVREPWKLAGIDPVAEDELIEGLPNELGETNLFEQVFGERNWTYFANIRDKGRDWLMYYELDQRVLEGYSYIDAFIEGYDEEGYTTRLGYDIIVRKSDHAVVLASATSIESNIELDR